MPHVFGPFLSYSVLFGLIWLYSVHFGPLCTLWSYSVPLVLFGPLRSNLVHSVYYFPIWSYSVLVDPIRSILSILVLYGLFGIGQSTSILFSPLWSTSDLFYLLWSIQYYSVQLGPYQSSTSYALYKKIFRSHENMQLRIFLTTIEVKFNCKIQYSRSTQLPSLCPPLIILMRMLMFQVHKNFSLLLVRQLCHSQIFRF